MIDFIKTKMLWVLLILFIASVAGNAYLFWGKGLIINKNTYITTTTTGYSNSGASAINNTIMGTTFYSANKKTEYQFKIFDTIEESIVFINTKNEGELYNSKVTQLANNKFLVIYRNMDVEFKSQGTSTVKTVNGVEVK